MLRLAAAGPCLPARGWLAVTRAHGTCTAAGMRGAASSTTRMLVRRISSRWPASLESKPRLGATTSLQLRQKVHRQQLPVGCAQRQQCLAGSRITSALRTFTICNEELDRDKQARAGDVRAPVR